MQKRYATAWSALSFNDCSQRLYMADAGQSRLISTLSPGVNCYFAIYKMWNVILHCTIQLLVKIAILIIQKLVNSRQVLEKSLNHGILCNNYVSSGTPVQPSNLGK